MARIRNITRKHHYNWNSIDPAWNENMILIAAQLCLPTNVIIIKGQLKQANSVAITDIPPRLIGNRDSLEPFSHFRYRLVWIVNGEHDILYFTFGNEIHQRGCSWHATCIRNYVTLEIFCESAFLWSLRLYLLSTKISERFKKWALEIWNNGLTCGVQPKGAVCPG